MIGKGFRHCEEALSAWISFCHPVAALLRESVFQLSSPRACSGIQLKTLIKLVFFIIFWIRGQATR